MSIVESYVKTFLSWKISDYGVPYWNLRECFPKNYDFGNFSIMEDIQKNNQEIEAFKYVLWKTSYSQYYTSMLSMVRDIKWFLNLHYGRGELIEFYAIYIPSKPNQHIIDGQELMSVLCFETGMINLYDWETTIKSNYKIIIITDNLQDNTALQACIDKINNAEASIIGCISIYGTSTFKDALDMANTLTITNKLLYKKTITQFIHKGELLKSKKVIAYKNEKDKYFFILLSDITKSYPIKRIKNEKDNLIIVQYDNGVYGLMTSEEASKYEVIKDNWSLYAFEALHGKMRVVFTGEQQFTYLYFYDGTQIYTAHNLRSYNEAQVYENKQHFFVKRYEGRYCLCK